MAAQVIVAHHLAAYGPVAQAGHAQMPVLFGFLSDCGAWAVSVFLVIAGYLAAQSLDEKPVDMPLVRRAMAHRYVRLAPVYLTGLTLAAGMALLLPAWVSPDMLPRHLDVSVWVINALFLQDILGQEALSAGVWYVAIDLQLYAAFLCLALLSHSMAWGEKGLIHRCLWAVVGMASLAYFNLHREWNVWAIYFAGTYALGALAYRSRRVSHAGDTLFWVFWVGAFLCAWVEPRPRLWVALITAATLYCAQNLAISTNLRTVIAKKMGDSAYGLFMSHFAMLMLWSFLYPFLEHRGWPFAVCLVAIFVSCNALGWFVWRYIDEAAARAFFHRRSHPPPSTFLNESKG